MTYVIAGRCIDGVVMIADKRLTHQSIGVSFAEVNKIFKCKDVLVGSAGSYGIANKINLTLAEKMEGDMKELDRIEIIEDVVKEAYVRYSIEGAETSHLVCFKDEDGKVKMYCVNYYGFSEPVTEYKGIGSGAVYGEILIKRVWEALWKLFELRKELSVPNVEHIGENLSITHVEPIMMNMIPYLTFPVLMVNAIGVDEAVGDNFNIWIYPDNGEPRELTKEEYNEVERELGFMLSFIDLGQFLERELENERKRIEKSVSLKE